MNVFKSYTFTWWQMAILKLALLSAGAAIGAYWHEFFNANRTAVIIIWILTAGYSLYIGFKKA